MSIRLTKAMLEAIIAASSYIEAGGSIDYLDSSGCTSDQEADRLEAEYANILKSGEWAAQELERRKRAPK